MKYLGLSLLSLQGALSWSLWSYVKQAEYKRLGLPVMTTPGPRKDTTTSKFLMRPPQTQFTFQNLVNLFIDTLLFI